MKLFCKRHYSYSRFPLNLNLNRHTQSRVPEILNLCKSGYLLDAINLLNLTDPKEIYTKPVIYASLLQTSVKANSFNHGLQIQSHIIKSGLEADRFVGNSLLSLYFKLCSDFSESEKVFNNLLVKDVISWTSMVSGYVRAGKPKQSLEIYCKMLEVGIESNAFTLSAMIKACSGLGDLRLGICFHAVVFVRGFDKNHVISSALIDMYGKNASPDDAHGVFEEMTEPDFVCWTTVISAFTRNDRYEKALEFYYLMQSKYNSFADEFTVGTVLTACGNLGRVKQGKEVHAKVVTAGICGNVIVESSLVDMYGKCGLVSCSRQVFDRMPKKNSVSWCALLGAYCQNGDFGSVIGIFREMEKTDDLYSFGTVLRACAGLAVVRQGKEVHCQYLKKRGWRDVVVESALVDLYAKCGLIDYAHRVFKEVPVRNSITWNSMICGYAQNGKVEEALRMFNEMINEGIKPDYISFIGVLFGFSHTGLVEQGRKYFKLMNEEYKIDPGVEHYNCMVDLLGRAGLLEEAEDLIVKSVFESDMSVWETLLGACTAQSDLVMATRVAKKMIELKPDYHLSYILLGNVYRAAGKWDDATKLRSLMKERGVKKMPGKSWIEISRSQVLNPTNLANAGLQQKEFF
ncbi:pentatricopeptide repeat-containing protein At1g03540-like [Papaver somniferum]|uniref:pentatricopeptide repeat-containing protein At1g03540-like n=1 Tax=Papaver somniferum TaxID=3469 RepID=UPI000E704BBF|nr:pentatricopeptide repeat-containing protein At1g03540-like [Papaver somniferum]